MVPRGPVVALIMGILLAGCGSNLKTKERVQEAILERLKTRSGLDLNALDVTTTSVSFNGNTAQAKVAFHPKGDNRVNSGMTMTYTLQEEGGKWVITNVGDSQGHGLMGHMPANEDQFPPGHPAVDGAQPSRDGRMQ